MPDDQQHNAFNESLQDRGWRQMSGRLDREMPVSDNTGPNIPLLAAILMVLLFTGAYWLLRPTEQTMQSVSSLPNIPMQTFDLEQKGEERDQLKGSMIQNTPAAFPVGENQIAGDKNGKDFNQKHHSNSISIRTADAVVVHAAESMIPQINSLSDMKMIELSTDALSKQLASLSSASIGSLSNRAFRKLQLTRPLSSLDREQRKPPFDKSFWLNIGARMGPRFSTEGYALGVGHQWFRNRWTIDLGAHFSMIDYGAFRDGMIHGIETDQRVTMKRFAFDEGAYRSYSDVLLIAGKSNFAGISATVGRGLYSGLYVSAGTSVHRVIGGESENVVITTESLSEDEAEIVPVNASNLVGQGVLTPWMWKASAGLTWHFTPSWAMTVRYEQSLNDLLQENQIAPDDRPEFQWIEIGMKFRIINY